jgi:hypothetical protein
MRLFTILSLTLLLPAAEAMWLALDDATLLEQSELIIEGRFVGHTSLRAAGRDRRFGVVDVQRIYKGTSTEPLVLLELPPVRDGYAVSTDIDFEPGQQGLWLLRKADGEDLAGVFAADHPQRFAATGSEAYERLVTLLH